MSTLPHRKSPRLPTWDYTTEWWYFVTICTKDHVPFFGQICSGRNTLTRLGEVAFAHWTQIPLHYPSVELDYFVVMPDHVMVFSFLLAHQRLSAGSVSASCSLPHQDP